MLSILLLLSFYLMKRSVRQEEVRIISRSFSSTYTGITGTVCVGTIQYLSLRWPSSRGPWERGWPISCHKIPATPHLQLSWETVTSLIGIGSELVSNSCRNHNECPQTCWDISHQIATLVQQVDKRVMRLLLCCDQLLHCLMDLLAWQSD